MPVLENLKHERYCNHVAEGMTQVEAYKASGFNAKHPASAASAISKRAEVKARIKELKGRIEKRTIVKVMRNAAVTKELVIRKLRENAERAESIKSGSAVANRAWELIGKELGMFVDREPVKPVTLEDLSTEDLERILAGPVLPDAVAEPDKGVAVEAAEPVQ